MLVSEPTNEPRNVPFDSYLSGLGFVGKPSSIGPMYSLMESDVRRDPTIRKSCFWFLLMVDLFVPIVKVAKFWELKPSVVASDRYSDSKEK